MHHLHHDPIRRTVLAATVVMAIGLLGGTAAAQAAPCVLTPATGSATQTSTTVTGGPANDTIDCSGATTVTTITGNGGNDTITGNNLGDTVNGGDGNDTITGGTGNDTLDGGLGIDTISGLAGNDTLIGSGADGSQDTLNGGDDTDDCQSPPEDIINGCETTPPPPATGPGSATANATQLCQASGGIFLNAGLLYTCTFLVGMNHRTSEAHNICTARHGTFTDVNLLVASNYTCTLPA
jgi:RTX calcium-binding nonapeptide repeat (4 copies)